LLPAFSSANATLDGFTIQINNYDSSFTWLPVSSQQSARVTISDSGLISVRGIAPSTPSTVQLTVTRSGFKQSISNTPTISSLSSNAFTVTFRSKNSVAVPSRVLAGGATLIWPVPVSTTYFQFIGWFDGEDTYTSLDSLTISKDVTFTAIWIPYVTYRVIQANTPIRVPLFDNRSVELTVPNGAVTAQGQVTASIQTTSTPEELNSGLVSVNIELKDSTGAKLTSFSEPLRLDLGLASSVNNSKLVWTRDNLTWNAIPLLNGTTLPNDQQDGYFIESSTNHIIVLTRHLTTFSFKQSQSPLTATTAAASVRIPNSAQIAVSGGNGTGEVSFTSFTALICSVSEVGEISPLSPAKPKTG
jgi:hypothetical protein